MRVPRDKWERSVLTKAFSLFVMNEYISPPGGSVQEIAEAMRSHAELLVQHIMFQCEPCTPEVLRRLTEALHLYR